ncbi:MAG: hypothetical protein K2X03_20935 [Bryobacteraceae bacterium]|nr:hypothetical protein [Bryobacteraceae bacterium]
MKYWGLLLAKIVAIAGFAWGTNWLIHEFYRVPVETLLPGSKPETHFFATMLWAHAIAGLCWAAMVDQRYRCRTCATRLRMPVATGSWGRATLFGRPKMEYICPYGHGTMNISQLQLTGRETPEWDRHGDMWKELESIGSSRD